MIKAPPEFARMGVWFEPDLWDLMHRGEDIVAFALSHVSRAEQQAIRRFLQEVLDTVRDPKALQLVWEQAGSRIIVPDDAQLRGLIGEIIARIDRHATGAPYRRKPAWPATLDIPPAFARLGVWFDQVILDANPEVTDIAAFALSQIDEADRQAIRLFLDEVLQTVHDDEALRAIWRSNAKMMMRGHDDLRALLHDIVRRIDERA